MTHLGKESECAELL